MSGQPAQTKTIRSQSLADMKDGAYASCERLPQESVLAEKLGISRTHCGTFWPLWSGRASSPAATELAPSSTAMC